MTPEGREASRSGDEEMGESFEPVDRDRSPDDVRYTLAPRPTAASRHRSDAGIDSPAREVKKYRANTEARMEVESRTPARAHPRSPTDSPAEGSRMQSRARLSNESRGLLSRDDHVHTTGESPETKKARGDAQMGSVTIATPMDKEDQRIMKLLLLGCNITEVFSPARVARARKRFGLVPGESFDLRTGYDLSDKDAQQYVRQRIDQSDSELLIASPPCTKFSRLQQLNIHVLGPEYEEKLAVDREAALKHIEFCIELLNSRVDKGRCVLFEHPALADSWQEPVMTKFAEIPGVECTVGDQCVFGLKTKGPPGEPDMAAKKPTRFMSNAWCIVDELSIRCDKSHPHQHLVGGRASKASEYPDGLCRAICRGLARQKKYDVSGKSCSSVVDKGQLMNPVGKIKKIDKIEDDPDDKRFQAHWIDTRHEVDGTDTMYAETSFSSLTRGRMMRTR